MQLKEVTTGRALYEEYRVAARQNGVAMDEWDDLDEGERSVWLRFALNLMPDESADN
ncbi:hypothetical protein L0Z42_29760 [Burkholderia multivorans]|uniref:hypothetical protein n=1 Tax=Burkholderia cepacia complex TaxID=87882 RepID=UPI00018E3AA5|nr:MULTISPECIES: hypothetical protein [Burkholderia cepacia complex]EED97325.1 hypothetical protein BURMUCGD1_6654 [Burkholderia multivorans CGD1]MBJ9625000.1 hypothetical protein [Burkholderia multivorans]MCO1374561.1 hypothetical protein [Burkholderia multivorans]MCO1374671.1 hypothetical protein [Burkholderia multivorans]MCO1459812.1 hypothetical protein [Burkholderia multivorans]